MDDQYLGDARQNIKQCCIEDCSVRAATSIAICWNFYSAWVDMLKAVPFAYRSCRVWRSIRAQLVDPGMRLVVLEGGHSSQGWIPTDKYLGWCYSFWWKALGRFMIENILTAKGSDCIFKVVVGVRLVSLKQFRRRMRICDSHFQFLLLCGPCRVWTWISVRILPVQCFGGYCMRWARARASFMCWTSWSWRCVCKVRLVHETNQMIAWLQLLVTQLKRWPHWITLGALLKEQNVQL